MENALNDYKEKNSSYEAQIFELTKENQIIKKLIITNVNEEWKNNHDKTGPVFNLSKKILEPKSDQSISQNPKCSLRKIIKIQSKRNLKRYESP